MKRHTSFWSSKASKEQSQTHLYKKFTFMLFLLEFEGLGTVRMQGLAWAVLDQFGPRTCDGQRTHKPVTGSEFHRERYGSRHELVTAPQSQFSLVSPVYHDHLCQSRTHCASHHITLDSALLPAALECLHICRGDSLSGVSQHAHVCRGHSVAGRRRQRRDRKLGRRRQRQARLLFLLPRGT